MITHMIEYGKSTTGLSNHTLCGIEYDPDNYAGRNLTFAQDVCLYGESGVTCDSCILLIFEMKAKYSNSYSSQCLCGRPCEYNNENCDGRICVSGHEHYCEYHVAYSNGYCLPIGYGMDIVFQ